MDITAYYSDPPHAYFTGLLGSDSSIGSKVALLGDHWFELDLASDRFRQMSIPALRPQQDNTERPGEQTLSAEGLWKRVGSTWTRGAGQAWYDRDQGDPLRFRSSRGVNVWTDWELSLLPDVDLIDTEPNGWNSMAVGPPAGQVTPRLAVAGNSGRLKLISQGGTETEVAGLAGSVQVTSAGGRIYVADDNGIHYVDTATSVAAFSATPTAAERIFFGKNRLFAMKGNQLWDVDDAGTTAEVNFNHMVGWSWTGACAGQAALFFCGYAADKGRVYAITIQEDGLGLNPPVVALELPDGETPWCMISYVGSVVIGTSLGVRVCQQQGTELTMGPLVGVDPEDPLGHDVRCLEPQDRFVWYGWDNTFDDAAGLGRLDLSTFVEPLAPAFASDLMGTQSGEVTAVATHREGISGDHRRWFTVGSHLYREAGGHVTTGYLETGRITFNVADEKTPVFVDLRHSQLLANESVKVEYSSDTADYKVAGTSGAPGTVRPIKEFTLNHNRAIYHELRVTLNGTGSDTPLLTNVTLAAQVAPDRSFNVYVPLLVYETITIAGQEYPVDIDAELTYLLELVTSQRVVRYRQGAQSCLVFAEDYEWMPHHATEDGQQMNGTFVMKLKSAEIAR